MDCLVAFQASGWLAHHWSRRTVLRSAFALSRGAGAAVHEYVSMSQATSSKIAKQRFDVRRRTFAVRGTACLVDGNGGSLWRMRISKYQRKRRRRQNIQVAL